MSKPIVVHLERYPTQGKSVRKLSNGVELQTWHYKTRQDSIGRICGEFTLSTFPNGRKLTVFTTFRP